MTELMALQEAGKITVSFIKDGKTLTPEELEALAPDEPVEIAVSYNTDKLSADE
jgi:hypothetical protein